MFANAPRTFKVGLQLPTSAISPIVAPIYAPPTTIDLGSAGGCGHCIRGQPFDRASDENPNFARTARADRLGQWFGVDVRCWFLSHVLRSRLGQDRKGSWIPA